MEFSYKPINPFQDDGLSKEDRAMIDAIRKTAYICGRRVDDIEYTVHQVLKQIGRDDLLPPCDKQKVNVKDEEAKEYQISEDILKDFEDFTKMLFTQGRDATSEERKSIDDYISRQAAIDCVTYDEEYTVECLNALPPVSPQTNIGWWIDEKVDGGRKVYCSKCNGSAVFEYVNDGDIYSSYGHGVIKKTKYCPNCGTKMLELNNVDWSKYTLQNVKERDNNDT